MVVVQIITALLVFLLLFDLYYSLSCFRQASILTHNTNHKGEHLFPSISSTQLNILVDGDSIAAGVGSTAFHRSISGRVGKHFKENYTVHLYNNAVSGSRVQDLITRPVPKKHYDLAVVVISSNDLFRFTWIRTFRDPVEQMYAKYSALADTVIVIGPGKVHATGGVPKISKPLYGFFGPLYGRVMAEEAQEFDNVVHINPYDNELDSNQYGNIEAADHFHPNDDGHRYWYDMFVLGLNRSNFKK